MLSGVRAGDGPRGGCGGHDGEGGDGPDAVGGGDEDRGENRPEAGEGASELRRYRHSACAASTDPDNSHSCFRVSESVTSSKLSVATPACRVVHRRSVGPDTLEAVDVGGEHAARLDAPEVQHGRRCRPASTPAWCLRRSTWSGCTRGRWPSGSPGWGWTPGRHAGRVAADAARTIVAAIEHVVQGLVGMEVHDDGAVQRLAQRAWMGAPGLPCSTTATWNRSGPAAGRPGAGAEPAPAAPERRPQPVRSCWDREAGCASGR
ncbi:hypothetical protein FHX44_118241 [Pseudonocardia hierapolitana]|uniref:Uncharacterized protein n=1 Tax=Pseudonocardia hierapolitana TaxID=1128676 RepID=A0A561T5B0_9PSEU|nr:hypothetical protein FHX44_118241 [Pseudonocardia hierapolitana]